MTDPRIEAAARALFGDRVDDCSGAREYLFEEVEKALAAADAAAWRHVKSTLPENEWVQIMAHHEGDDHYAIAKWCRDRNCWMNRDIDMMYSPVYFDRWCPIHVTQTHHERTGERDG